MYIFFVESVYMDGERNWNQKYNIFAEYYVGLEGNKTSRLKPSWMTHRHRGGEMRSAARGFWEVSVLHCWVDENLFSSALLLTIVYAMMILMSEHTHNIHIRGEWRWGHIWELPVLHYHKIMVIYPYPFSVVITQLFSWIIFTHDCICILPGSPG